MTIYKAAGENANLSGTVTSTLRRGDYLVLKGRFGQDTLRYNQFNITRV
jgi:hypothetical protein